MTSSKLVIGIDVGSTTCKMAVVDPATREIIWNKYLRHETKQPEYVRDMLTEIEAAFPDVSPGEMRVFITGSGGGPIAPHIGAKFVQEVNAVTMSVEALHPDVGSVIELGGQDAKIIIFKENAETGSKQATCSMNDKCASGTGATIDKCMIKVGMPRELIPGLMYDESKLHHVAAKCGVFAETDIVNLVKSGIPRDEILNSLADAIVQQNLSVLTRGNTLRARVLLLGGPNTYLPFLQQCWRKRIPESWEERGYEFPRDVPVEELIYVPKNAELYAAYGAVLYGMHEPAEIGRYTGLEGLREFIAHGRKAKLGDKAGPGLVHDEAQQDEFVATYKIPRFREAELVPGSVVRGAIGLDGGSTSSKCVLIDEQGEILKKVYQLSKGNPIQDMKDMFVELRAWAEEQGATLDIMAFGVTGYAGDVMERALAADANIVETVAHMMSAKHFFPNVDVICDIGGQDIKVLFMQAGDIKNFRLSNSCSAGNGMLLQAMADQFGLPVTEYAAHAFQARLSPKFSYGCAVFLDSDRVNFQKEGYAREELLAGLALVLPKNVWQYVVQIPRMAELGRVFVLQGGTQHNMAALKAQVDYIEERVPGAEVYVHPHTGEAGALGAAMEALRVVQRRGHSTFVGLDQAIDIAYTSTNDETTRCDFCPNNCSRTFIDTATTDGTTARYISGFSCEKGTVEDMDALRALNADRKQRMTRYPNLVDFEAKLCFRQFFTPAPMPASGALIDDVEIKRGLLGGVRRKPIKRPFRRSSAAAQKRREDIRIGIPRVLNLWTTAPLWRTYFETLGIHTRNVVFSDETSEEMWQAGGKYGSIDPCYPGKVAQAHIHDLLFNHHEKKALQYIFFPCITHIQTFVENTMDTATCPVVAGTPKVMQAAFTKEIDFFSERGIEYLAPATTLHEQLMLKRQMFEAFGERLGVTEDESDFAIDQGFRALGEFDRIMQEKGRILINEIERDDRIALLMIGRPYHNDPGLNHSVLEEYQALGYPILSMRSIPKDRAFLDRFFAEDLRKELVPSPLDINDVWPENYSVNSVQKVWAAKFAARHPNVAVLDLSSFKCGHDAPTYGLIDSIIAAGKTPYSALHDIDANKPTGSIKIRVKTYAYTLMLARERLEDARNKRRALDVAIARKKLELMERVARERGTSMGLQREMEALRLQIEALQQDMAARATAAAEAKARREEDELGHGDDHEHGDDHSHGHSHDHGHGPGQGHILPPTARRAPGLAVIE
jgi:activator of 2-hydroxyglutaryl-CoA dehydratase/predicted nucleotide-binding protein (sugar kinase/HSP70/actin superfamily)